MSVWGVQFSVGDQGDNKKLFWQNDLKICPHCNEKNIKDERIPCECRMNGDAVGTTVFECNSCGWKTSFLFDDSLDTYFYETKNW